MFTYEEAFYAVDLQIQMWGDIESLNAEKKHPKADILRGVRPIPKMKEFWAERRNELQRTGNHENTELIQYLATLGNIEAYHLKIMKAHIRQYHIRRFCAGKPMAKNMKKQIKKELKSFQGSSDKEKAEALFNAVSEEFEELKKVLRKLEERYDKEKDKWENEFKFKKRPVKLSFLVQLFFNTEAPLEEGSDAD